MGIFNLFGFCIALLFAPALAFANDVRVGVSPTTGYYEVTSKTFNVPKGASVSSSTAVSPTVTPLAGGGFQQSMGGGITIEGLKQPAPFTARAAAGLATMRNGAKKLYKSNPARFAASVGFGLMLNQLDWIMGEGGKITKIIPPQSDTDAVCPAGSTCYQGMGEVFSASGNITSQECSDMAAQHGAPIVLHGDNYPGNYCRGYKYTAFRDGQTFYYIGKLGSFSHFSNKKPAPNVSEPLPDSEILSAIDSSYNPDSSDFVLLTPYFPPEYILVDPIPPVITDLGITNTFDSSGWLTGTEQKTSTTEFTVSNNSTSQPSISSSTSVKTETFKDGQSQGSTVTETTQPAVGGGGGKAPTVEIPTDCDFHPTLCAWMNWTKEPLEEPDHDLKQIMHTVDFEEKKTISFGSKSCPAPYDIHLGLIDRTYQLSFQPACDFAGYLYFFVMAAAYIFAAYISVGVVRNG